jgi:hypothetical protein
MVEDTSMLKRRSQIEVVIKTLDNFPTHVPIMISRLAQKSEFN